MRPLTAISITLSAIVLVIVSAVMMEPVSSGTFPGTNGKIAFSSNISGSYDIWVMDADGSNQTNITNTSAADRLPAWSPDGTKIVYKSDVYSGSIFVMDADGSNKTAVRMINNSKDYHPQW